MHKGNHICYIKGLVKLSGYGFTREVYQEGLLAIVDEDGEIHVALFERQEKRHYVKKSTRIMSKIDWRYSVRKEGSVIVAFDRNTLQMNLIKCQCSTLEFWLCLQAPDKEAILSIVSPRTTPVKQTELKPGKMNGDMSDILAMLQDSSDEEDRKRKHSSTNTITPSSKRPCNNTSLTPINTNISSTTRLLNNASSRTPPNTNTPSTKTPLTNTSSRRSNPFSSTVKVQSDSDILGKSSQINFLDSSKKRHTFDKQPSSKEVIFIDDENTTMKLAQSSAEVNERKTTVRKATPLSQSKLAKPQPRTYYSEQGYSARKAASSMSAVGSTNSSYSTNSTYSTKKLNETPYSTSTPTSQSKNFLSNAVEKASSVNRTQKFYGKENAATPFSFTRRRPGPMPNLSNAAQNPVKSEPSKPRTYTRFSSWKPKSEGNLQGFSNIGNTCYMNSILQALFGLVPFMRDMTHCMMACQKHNLIGQDTVLYNLWQVYRQRGHGTPYDIKQCLRRFKSAFSRDAKRFSGYHQHDAHEFISVLINQQKEEISKLKATIPSSLAENPVTNAVTENFEFKLKLIFTCQSCGEELTKEETMNDLSLPLPKQSESACTIQDCFDAYLSQEAIAHTCSNCQSSKATVQHIFNKLPRLLLVHVKRYHYSSQSSVGNRKLDRPIGIPKFINVGEYCREETQPPSLPACPVPSLLPAPLQSNTSIINTSTDSTVAKRKLNYSQENGAQDRAPYTWMAAPAKKTAGNVDVVPLLYAVGFLDLFGVSMIIPLLSRYLMKDLGASPSVAGLMGSLYGVLQLVSSPIVGHWSDVSGRSYTLFVCLFISAVGYVGISMATVIHMAFVARIPLGIFKHSLSISRAYIADIVPKKDQSKVFGRFNSFSSIGFIVGPPMGGHLSEWPGGFRLVTFLCAIIFFLNAAMVWFFLPEKNKNQPHPELVRDESVMSLRRLATEEINFSPFQFIKAFQKIDWTVLWDIFTLRLLLSFAMIIYRSNFSITLIEKYDTSNTAIGYIISFTALISAGAGFLCGTISRWYKSDEKLLMHCTVVLVFAMIMCTSMASNIAIFLIFTIPQSLCNSVSRICITNITIKKAHGHDNGALMGLGQSIISISRIISPALAGLVQEVSIDGPGIMGSFLCVISVVIMVVFPLDRTIRTKTKAE